MNNDKPISQESNAIFDDFASLAFIVGPADANGTLGLSIYGDRRAFVEAARSLPPNKIRDLRAALQATFSSLSEKEGAQ